MWVGGWVQTMCASDIEGMSVWVSFSVTRFGEFSPLWKDLKLLANF